MGLDARASDLTGVQCTALQAADLHGESHPCQIMIAHTLDNWQLFVRNLLQTALDELLPQECLLCASTGGHDAVCPRCQGEILPLPPGHCPRCAMPVNTAETCGRCLARPPHFDATHAAFRYAPPGDGLITALKYGHRLPAAAFLAKHLARSLQRPSPGYPRSGGHGQSDPSTPSSIDWVIGMPLHPRRLAQRGFNQSVEIGRFVAQSRGLPFSTGIVERVRDTQPQADLPLRRRSANVRRAFACLQEVAGKRIAVVDDVMTSGATLDEVARTLKRAGASHVENWVLARTWPHD